MLFCDIHYILDISVISVDRLNMKLLVTNKYQQTRNTFYYMHIIFFFRLINIEAFGIVFKLGLTRKFKVI